MQAAALPVLLDLFYCALEMGETVIEVDVTSACGGVMGHSFGNKPDLLSICYFFNTTVLFGGVVIREDLRADDFFTFRAGLMSVPS